MLVNVDAKALEWAVAIQLSQDPVGMAELLAGEDVHTNNEKAFKLPSRLIAKKYLFQTIYLGSGYSFANNPEFSHVSSSPKYWDRVGEQFYEKYSGLEALHQKWGKMVVEGRAIEGPTGRFWTVPMDTDYKGQPKIPWTKLANWPIQGTGADVMMMVRLAIRSKLYKLGFGVCWFSTIHDSMTMDVPDDKVEVVAKVCFEAFDELPKYFKHVFNVTLSIPFPGEVSIGPNMGDLTEITKEEVSNAY